MENLRPSPNPYDDAAVAGADRFEPPDSTAGPEPNDPPAHIEGYPVPADGAADGGAGQAATGTP
jgi:hypothetical protein